LFGGSSVNLLIKRIAEAHQLVDSGDDAVLFGERWERKLLFSRLLKFERV
jgi:hypothetical protein